MQVTVNVPDKLVAAAKNKGQKLEEYVEKVLLSHAEQLTDDLTPKSVFNAINRIHQLRQGIGEK